MIEGKQMLKKWDLFKILVKEKKKIEDFFSLIFL